MGFRLSPDLRYSTTSRAWTGSASTWRFVSIGTTTVTGDSSGAQWSGSIRSLSRDGTAEEQVIESNVLKIAHYFRARSSRSTTEHFGRDARRREGAGVPGLSAHQGAEVGQCTRDDRPGVRLIPSGASELIKDPFVGADLAGLRQGLRRGEVPHAH